MAHLLLQEALSISNILFKSIHNKQLINQPTHTVHLGHIVDGKRVLDEVLVAKLYNITSRSNYITNRCTKHLFKHPNFEFIEHDVTNHINIAQPIDYILHFASPASPIDYLKIPIQTLKVGSLGTHNLLGLAKAKNARILIASTSVCDDDTPSFSAWVHHQFNLFC